MYLLLSLVELPLFSRVSNNIAGMQILKCTASEVMNSDASEIRRQCTERLREMMGTRTLYEARIKSVVIGDDRYFFLDEIDL